jgi:hypothetical protein
MTEQTAVHDVVVRLSRPSSGGGHVIERAAMRAEGARFHEVEAGVLAHGGAGEAAPAQVGRGLFADRGDEPGVGSVVRYVLPAGALD